VTNTNTKESSTAASNTITNTNKSKPFPKKKTYQDFKSSSESGGNEFMYLNNEFTKDEKEVKQANTE
jgi:hypothetical protein